MSQSREPRSADTPPLTISALLGAPALIQGENLRSYEELLQRVSTALKPQDALEEIWIRDIVDLVWEAFRLRRARANVVINATSTRLELELGKTYPHAGQISRGRAAGDEDAASQVEKRLASRGLSLDKVAADAMQLLSEFTHPFDRALTNVEMRRSAALRDLAKYRAPLAQKLRKAIAQTEAAALAPDAPPLATADPA